MPTRDNPERPQEPALHGREARVPCGEHHWDGVHTTKSPEQTSWYQAHLRTSLEWIVRAAPSHDSAIADIGAGQSTLIDDLLAAGYRNLTALDISAEALRKSQSRLAASSLAHTAASVCWLTADIAQPDLPPEILPPASIHLWHDRAVFHFLTISAQRQAYAAHLAASLRPSGRAIVATFGPEGPQKCSGLPTERYSAESLANALGSQFTLQRSALIDHTTPAGTIQQFLYCDFLRV